MEIEVRQNQDSTTFLDVVEIDHYKKHWIRLYKLEEFIDVKFYPGDQIIIKRW